MWWYGSCNNGIIFFISHNSNANLTKMDSPSPVKVKKEAGTFKPYSSAEDHSATDDNNGVDDSDDELFGAGLSKKFSNIR
jgi:hypothetical protein